MAGGAGGYEAFLAFMDGSAAAPSTTIKTETESKPVTNVDDGYSYEEEQEREAMMKSYHHPMKQWFRDNAHLVDKYGAFPLFWQDLKTWAPYREVLKRFLRETEGGGSGSENGNGDIKKDTPTEAKAEASTAQNGSSESGEQPLKRRKKSRWGDAVEDNATEAATTTTTATTTEEGEKKRKKSRWAPAAATPGGNLVTMLSQQQQQSMALRTKLEGINQKMLTVAVDAARLEKDPNRSPSPPPQYDGNGKRTNTREVRMRAALEKERSQVIEQMIKINPLFRPPADYQRSKLSRKIYIPIHEYPNYNFIGLIIGPRGNTQKRMEKESNCKIAIRGKGSVKEGSKGKKMNADENDDLHVLIMGEREEDIDKAAKEVQALLVPVDDMKNDHKQKQLRELALINGTLRDDDFCYVCGEKGHRQSECPNREKHFKAVDVRCAICGDSSHPTRDCTQRGKSAAENAEIDKEYQNFMQQLGQKPVISTAAKPAAAAAPWLQPVKSTTTTSQPWLNPVAGAPGMSDAPPPPGTLPAGPPGTQPAGAPVLGSTPATAFPPPIPVAGATYGAYPQAQAWNQGYYYGAYDQSGAGTAANPSATAEYQQYAQYDPNAANASYGYQYQSYQPPQ